MYIKLTNWSDISAHYLLLQVTDLGEANRVRARHLTWYKLYSAKEAYGLTSLNPLQWDDLVMSMYDNKKLFDLYYRYEHSYTPNHKKLDHAISAI